MKQIQGWFKEEVKKDTDGLNNLCRAFQKNGTFAIEKHFTAFFGKTICIRNTSVKKNM